MFRRFCMNVLRLGWHQRLLLLRWGSLSHETSSNVQGSITDKLPCAVLSKIIVPSSPPCKAMAYPRHGMDGEQVRYNSSRNGSCSGAVDASFLLSTWDSTDADLRLRVLVCMMGD
eukprot:scaffold764_cov363-Pavlova_lutheri.AAC.15